MKTSKEDMVYDEQTGWYYSLETDIANGSKRLIAYDRSVFEKPCSLKSPIDRPCGKCLFSIKGYKPQCEYKISQLKH